MIFIILVIYISLLYLFDAFIFNNSKERINLYLKLILVPMLLLLGFRSLNTGVDTEQYYLKFQLLRNLDFNDAFGTDLEFGYRLFQILLHKLGLNFQVLLMIVTMFYMGAIYKIISMFSTNVFNSLLLFLGFGFYSFAFSGIRQTIAIAFIVFAFIQLTKKKEIKALVLILLGASFHISALIFIPVIFVRFLKLSSIFMFSTFMLFLILSYFFIDYVRLLMINFARIDYGVVTTGGLKLYFINWIMLLIPLFNWKEFKREYYNIILFTIMFFGVLVFPILRINPVTLRVSYYFQIFMILYLPIALDTVRYKFVSKALGYLYVIVGIFWLFSDLLPKAELFDYTFFWM